MTHPRQLCALRAFQVAPAASLVSAVLLLPEAAPAVRSLLGRRRRAGSR